LKELESKIVENKNNKNNKYGEYYSYMYSGTNSRKARITRSEVFKEYIFA